MEREVTNSREVILKLENQVRELQIKFEEEQFTRKWNKDNHEKMHMQQLVQELQA